MTCLSIFNRLDKLQKRVPPCFGIATLECLIPHLVVRHMPCSDRDRGVWRLAFGPGGSRGVDGTDNIEATYDIPALLGISGRSGQWCLFVNCLLQLLCSHIPSRRPQRSEAYPTCSTNSDTASGVNQWIWRVQGALQANQPGRGAVGT
jgi:hypothetical protein